MRTGQGGGGKGFLGGLANHWGLKHEAEKTLHWWAGKTVLIEDKRVLLEQNWVAHNDVKATLAKIQVAGFVIELSRLKEMHCTAKPMSKDRPLKERLQALEMQRAGTIQLLWMRNPTEETIKEVFKAVRAMDQDREHLIEAMGGRTRELDPELGIVKVFIPPIDTALRQVMAIMEAPGLKMRAETVEEMVQRRWREAKEELEAYAITVIRARGMQWEDANFAVLRSQAEKAQGWRQTKVNDIKEQKAKDRPRTMDLAGFPIYIRGEGHQGTSSGSGEMRKVGEKSKTEVAEDSEKDSDRMSDVPSPNAKK